LTVDWPDTCNELKTKVKNKIGRLKIKFDTLFV